MGPIKEEARTATRTERDPGHHVSGEPEQATCTACPHLWAAHDALGRRFCTATRVVGWSRGCICR
jgi:hypothetical protein